MPLRSLDMLSLNYTFSILWEWLTGTGLDLAILIVCVLLVPRVGRFALWFINRRIDKNEEEEGPDEGKTQRAFAGVAVYIAQLIAFFLLSVLFLQTLGFSLTGAAIPATVASAAVGFGAQSIIADFLAGFFILTEKQFGVGDWVRFEGNGITVEGSIIQVTMRATRIRTLAQETVIVPNSTARVCINASNYWSRAVVVIPVPLQGSSDAGDTIERSEAATRRALARPEIAAELLGELDVHPAVDIQPPSVVGMPWMVNMRFMIQVTAGNHWMVERAIRTEILDEFWDEYGSATTVSGELREHLSITDQPATGTSDLAKAMPTAPRIDVDYDRPRTESAASEAPTAVTRATGAAGVAGAAGAAGSAATRPSEAPTEITGKPNSGDIADVPEGMTDEEGLDPARTKSETLAPDTSTPETKATAKDDPGATGVFAAVSADDAAETTETSTESEEAGEEKTRWRQILTLGGRARASTTVLLALLVVLLILRLFTVEPSEDWIEQRRVLESEQEVTPTEEEPAVPTETGTIEPTEPTNTFAPTTPTAPTTEGGQTPQTQPDQTEQPQDAPVPNSPQGTGEPAPTQDQAPTQETGPQTQQPQETPGPGAAEQPPAQTF